MKKYLFKRILFSLFSLVVVIAAVIILIYNLMNRNSILQNDEMYRKLQYNEQTVQKYKLFQDYGYLSYENYTNTEAYDKLSAEEKADIVITMNRAEKLSDLEVSDTIRGYLTSMQNKGYTVDFLPTKFSRKGVLLSQPYLICYRESNVFERLGSFFSNLFRVETIWDVNDENLTDRYIRLEWDRRSNMPALVGSGTYHKYLIYFDSKFPFVHQNFFHIQLGKSYNMQKGSDVVEYMKSYTGLPEFAEQILPKDIDNPAAVATETSYDFHTVTYNKNHGSSVDLLYFSPDDPYTNVGTKISGMSRIGTSFVIGIISTFFAYLFGLPLGVWMAQRKDKLVDKLGNVYIIFIMAVPSLAYIFMFASIGTSLFNLPYKFVFSQDSVLPYILPVVSLALPSIGALMRWMRRFMIDQTNSDYVKFARSQGLSEGEIFSKHISRNALIFLVHGIPANILGNLVGAIITERVYGVPGVGNMLTTAITNLDNAVIIGVTVFYTTLTIVSLILGDLLLAKYDPRISLSSERN